MQPPCEVMVSKFLPNMRGLVSHELSERGESQRHISTLLGITQARVSYYLNKKKSTFLDELQASFTLSEAEFQNYAKVISEDVIRNPVDGIFTLYSVWKNLLFKGSVCEIHHTQYRVTRDCSVCMDLMKPAQESLGQSRGSEDSKILKDISNAVALIENSTIFPYVMPEVSVNIAVSRSNPKSIRDVAAIPGRMNKIHGRAKAHVLPEFGSSNHMSNVLLIFNSKNPKIRAVMNMKYDAVMGRVLSEIIPQSRISTTVTRFEITSEPPEDQVIPRLKEVRLHPAKDGEGTYVVIDKGSKGVEPITYLLGDNAAKLAEMALKISVDYNTAQARL